MSSEKLKKGIVAVVAIAIGAGMAVYALMPKYTFIEARGMLIRGNMVTGKAVVIKPDTSAYEK